jgi:4-amino-4-deoxy-L-arabinose transferase-like glycosyltransferase
VCALHPYLIFATRVPGIPAALIFMTTLVLYATIKCITSNGKNTFSAGVSWGIAILTHGCFLPLFLPVVFFIFTFTQDSWLMRIRRSFILCIVTVLVVSPWSFRNWLTFDRLIPVATGGALQYWIADYVYFHSDISDKDPISESFKQISVDFEKDNHRKLRQSHGGILSLEDDDLLSKKAKQQISSDPTILFARFFKGFTMFWVTMDRGIVKTIIVSLINVPFLLLAIILSLVMARRRCFTKEYAFVAVFILSFWCLFAIVQAVGPYFVAITPCLFFLICYGMNQISKQKSIA